MSSSDDSREAHRTQSSHYPPSAQCQTHSVEVLDHVTEPKNPATGGTRVMGLDMPPVRSASAGSSQDPIRSGEGRKNHPLSSDTVHYRSGGHLFSGDGHLEFRDDEGGAYSAPCQVSIQSTSSLSGDRSGESRGSYNGGSSGIIGSFSSTSRVDSGFSYTQSGQGFGTFPSTSGSRPLPTAQYAHFEDSTPSGEIQFRRNYPPSGPRTPLEGPNSQSVLHLRPLYGEEREDLYSSQAVGSRRPPVQSCDVETSPERPVAGPSRLSQPSTSRRTLNPEFIRGSYDHSDGSQRNIPAASQPYKDSPGRLSNQSTPLKGVLKDSSDGRRRVQFLDGLPDPLAEDVFPCSQNRQVHSTQNLLSAQRSDSPNVREQLKSMQSVLDSLVHKSRTSSRHRKSRHRRASSSSSGSLSDFSNPEPSKRSRTKSTVPVTSTSKSSRSSDRSRDSKSPSRRRKSTPHHSKKSPPHSSSYSESSPDSSPSKGRGRQSRQSRSHHPRSNSSERSTSNDSRGGHSQSSSRYFSDSSSCRDHRHLNESRRNDSDSSGSRSPRHSSRSSRKRRHSKRRRSSRSPDDSSSRFRSYPEKYDGTSALSTFLIHFEDHASSRGGIQRGNVSNSVYRSKEPQP